LNRWNIVFQGLWFRVDTAIGVLPPEYGELRGVELYTSKIVCYLKDLHSEKPRYKCRLVAHSYSETPGVDYTDTFAPVIKTTSLRTIFAVASHLNMNLHNFDVKTAFLYPDTRHEAYIEQPDYFEIPGSQNKTMSTC
jgi:Reverse transcriptase (RNA-dependent DNA polymerase)